MTITIDRYYRSSLTWLCQTGELRGDLWRFDSEWPSNGQWLRGHTLISFHDPIKSTRYFRARRHCRSVARIRFVTVTMRAAAAIAIVVVLVALARASFPPSELDRYDVCVVSYVLNVGTV